MRYPLPVIAFLTIPMLAQAESNITYAEVAARLDAVAALRSQRLTEHAPDLPDSAWQQAAAGEVVTGVRSVPGHAAKIGWGVAVMEASIEQLWAGLNDELQHTELLGLEHIEIVQGTPCADRRHVMMLLPLPIVSDRWWVIENRYNTALAEQTSGRVRELAWTGQTDPSAAALSAAARQKVAGAVPVTFNHGGWLLIALDDEHTLGEYFSWSDPGGELPAGPTSTFAGAVIAKTMRAMTHYANTQVSTCE